MSTSKLPIIIGVGMIVIIIVAMVVAGVMLSKKPSDSPPSPSAPSAPSGGTPPSAPSGGTPPAPPAGSPLEAGQCRVNQDCTSDPALTKCLIPPGGTLGVTVGVCSRCNASSDCSSGQVCFSGTCMVPSAVPDVSCTTSNASTVCANNPRGTKCSVPTGSLTGTCQACGINTDCPLATPICSNGSCYVCTNDADCGTTGKVCRDGGTANAQCVATCTTDAGCQSELQISNAVCAYKSTAFAACAIPCANESECTDTSNPTPGATKCWEYINGAVTQFKAPVNGGGYCVTPGPQKCCWNRSRQSCSSSSECNTGGEGCINSGDVTQQFGKVTCNICENEGKILDDSKTNCVMPYSTFSGELTGNNYFSQARATYEDCASSCLNDPNCMIFNYDINSKECWRMRPPRYDNIKAFYRHNDGSYTSAGPHHPDQNDLGQINNTTEQSCKSSCTTNPRCIIASHETSTGRCILKGVNPAATNRKTGIIRKTYT